MENVEKFTTIFPWKIQFRIGNKRAFGKRVGGEHDEK